MLEILQDLATGAGGGERPRFLRSSPARQRIVRAIEDYQPAYPRPAPTADDVATALGVSAPRLRRAIRASFGISLQRYLLLRRLTLFRIALRSAGPRDRSPREIALAHGFWHFGRLVQDYRSVFSEDLGGLLGENGTSRQRDILVRRAGAG